MPSAPYLSSINSGELSPRMEARVDFDRYPNAAKRCRNLVLFPQGGAARRPGTRYINPVKTQSDRTVVLPFEYSEEDSYVIEGGNLYFRFYRHQQRLLVAATDAAITNGTFAAGITGWTSLSTGTAAIAHDATNQRLQLTGAAGSYAWAQQAVTITAPYINVRHVLRFTMAVAGGGHGHLQIGSSSGGDQIVEELELGPGQHAISFEPGTTTFYIQFKNNNDPVRNVYIDNVEFLSDQPLELVTPFTTSDLMSLQQFQAADIVYLCNQTYQTRKLERRSHYSWSLVEVFFEDGPYFEVNGGNDLEIVQIVQNALFDNGLTNWTDNSVGEGFVIHNEAGKFAELDPGADGGASIAVMRTTATVVTAKKHVAHVLVVAAGPITVNFGTTAGGTEYFTAQQQPGWISYEFTTTGTTLHIEFRHNDYDKGRAGIGGCQVYNQDARLLEPSAKTGDVALTALGFAPFVAGDVGRIIRLEWPGQDPGYGVITSFVSATAVTFLVLRNLPSLAPTENWRFGAFGGVHGHPKVVGFFDGRSVFANTISQPNTCWFSQSGKLEVMRPNSFEEGAVTIEDDDAINVTLRSSKINPIFWLSGQKQLMAGTAGGEWVIQSSGAVVTPTDISAKQHAAVACADIKNVEINQTIVFADRAQRSLHDLGFSLQEDTFLATDLNILADHMFRSPVEQMIYQRTPYSLVWARRADGRLASMAYNKQHVVLGWAHTLIGGSFDGSDAAVVESITVIPGAEDDAQHYHSDERAELWLVVKRTIDGQTTRYIEMMEYFFDGVLREDYDSESAWQAAMRTEQADAFYVDCGITYDGVPATVITGLDHLEGEIVKVLADGIVLPDFVVASGTIALSNAATKVQVGLPYKHSYESLKISVPVEGGVGVNKVKIITAVGLVLLDTLDFKMTTVEYDEDGRRLHDLYTIRFLRDHMNENEAVPLYSGEVTPSTEGVYSRDARIYIESDAPTPFAVLGLAPQMEVRNV